ncbi:hypothetical protein GQ457_05G030660 [Hibiscus cannabinus]
MTSGLKIVWSNWGHEMKSVFKRDYRVVARLLHVPIDQTLLQALVKYWNTPYSCFTFSHVDLTPTSEEYLALINCSKIDDGIVYSKPNKNKPFRGKLHTLSEALHSWVEDKVATNNHNEWEGILTLALVSPGGQVQRDMFSFLIYGLVLYPKALRRIGVSVLDLFDLLSRGVNPVPVILAETFRTLNFCKRIG